MSPTRAGAVALGLGGPWALGGPRPWGALKSSKIDEISRVRGQEDSKLTAEVSRIDWERHLSMKFEIQIEKVGKTEVRKIIFMQCNQFQMQMQDLVIMRRGLLRLKRFLAHSKAFGEPRFLVRSKSPNSKI